MKFNKNNIFFGIVILMNCYSSTAFVKAGNFPNDDLSTTINLNIQNWDPKKEQQFLFKNVKGAKTIDKTFWPIYMKNIDACLLKDMNFMNVKQSSKAIIFVLIVTPEYVKQFMRQTSSLRLYCEIHGYNLQIIDPIPILQKLYYPNTVFDMVLAPSVMREIFQDLYRSHGCQISWLVVLDIDIFVIDYERKIESFIHYANNHAGKNRKCKIIAQDSSTSLNTGRYYYNYNYFIIIITAL
jgi:hypothetical protein